MTVILIYKKKKKIALGTINCIYICDTYTTRMVTKTKRSNIDNSFCVMMISQMTKFIMFFLILISITCLSFALSSEYSISSHGNLDKFSSDEEVFELFQSWKKEHGRDYANSEEENANRLEIFKTNFKYINEMNAKTKSPTQHRLSLNKFADMSPEEFSKTYLPNIETQIPSDRDNVKLKDDDDCENLPTSVDWREKGAVTEVRDQGDCRKILLIIPFFITNFHFCISFLLCL